MALPALTIFTGAFLLFLVQPLIGKYILPWFGGTPAVWTTCLLFFQTVLLGGYAYAHWLTDRLRPRTQAAVHLVLLAASLLWLPITPDAGWKPAPGDEPTLRILLLLAATIGLPYLLLSATGPLVQRWFSLAHPGVPPYRLYALSNAGSLLALLAFPFVLEPLTSRAAQGLGWSAGHLGFVALCAGCAWRVRRLAGAGPAAGQAAAETDPFAAGPTAADRLLWVLLPAAASVLLMGTTNKLCLDVAVIPFLWILPLGLYLLSFILAFDHPRWYARGPWVGLFAAGAGAVAYLLSAGSAVRLPVQIATYSLTLFAACMVCHGELYRLRPAPQRLTRYYLYVAAGGAGGGALVALGAPLLLDGYYELQAGLVFLAYLVGVICLLHQARPLALGAAVGALALSLLIPLLRAKAADGVEGWLAACALEWQRFHAERWREIVAVLLLLLAGLRGGGRVPAPTWTRRMPAVPLMLSVLLGMAFIIEAVEDRRWVRDAARNFYGTLQVKEFNADQPDSHFFLLAHGGTTHGLQFTGPDRSWWATTYYGAASGIGRAIDQFPGTRRVGLVGLGTGTLAAYGRPGDTFCFFEINPVIEHLARHRFTYLEHSPADLEVALGDARLVLEEELARGRPRQFDLLALDAFSSDSIPVHLLTREAFAVYLGHLRPGGVIAVHISNRYLDLKPVVAGLAAEYQLACVTLEDEPEKEDWWLYSTTWMLLTRDARFFEGELVRTAISAEPAHPRPPILWTDDHASLLGVLK
ncbi:MAG: hypothetical protein JNG83_13430 [Opitutaceae bacterium]|nr:hypothetical protein [Opitutaceae bacterium]